MSNSLHHNIKLGSLGFSVSHVLRNVEALQVLHTLLVPIMVCCANTPTRLVRFSVFPTADMLQICYHWCHFRAQRHLQGGAVTGRLEGIERGLKSFQPKTYKGTYTGHYGQHEICDEYVVVLWCLYGASWDAAVPRLGQPLVAIK